MPTFKLDDREIPFEPGDTVIRAAWRQGIEIPHYCWHPGLSVAANCRMCLVEIRSGNPVRLPVLRWDETRRAWVDDEKPKLQPACQYPASEGLEVSTRSEHVRRAQAAVQELLLLNHPVDCPICDQAGECKLQDYWLEHQARLKRKKTEPVHKPKAVRFGPTIVYDAERCILCTRCVRFCNEIVGDPVLSVRERGNRGEIVLAPGRELDHGYTLMTEHVCPVGALTSRDFRFKARVWLLRTAPGICTGCATGCNTWVDYDPRTGRVMRLRPRDNLEVNRFWMCDDGMLSYRQLEQGRLWTGAIGRGPDRIECAVGSVVEKAARALASVPSRRTAVVLSAGQSCEDNTAAVRFAREVLGTDRLYLAARGGWRGDDILRNRDDNPNTAGARLAAGGDLDGVEGLLEDVLAGEVEAVVALGHACREDVAALAPLARLAVVVVLASHESPLSEVASFVIPVATWAEQSGSYVNAKGMRQRFARAVPPPAGVRTAWETLAAMARASGKVLDVSDLEPRAPTAVGGARAVEARP